MEERRQGIQLDKGVVSVIQVASFITVLVGLLWGGVIYVIIPINTLQVTSTQILVAQKVSNQNYAALQLQVAQLESDNAVNKNDINDLKEEVLGASLNK